ncbi:hypothetical protein G9A89_000284 [Geosiphon pyriformis]|nr:hypothetical protein G9A89_000284 [Geosiphon pyriformis]
MASNYTTHFSESISNHDSLWNTKSLYDNQKIMYQICCECNQPRTNFAWCKKCETLYFAEKFLTWTSGNTILDEIIQLTQMEANQSADYLEWIPFDQFELIEYYGKGTWSTIYSAIWLDGPRWDWDEIAQEWIRSGPLKVALKRLDNSRELSQEFLEKIRLYHHCIQSGSLADTFGVTKDETGCYMFVMRFYENGSLDNYLDHVLGDISWRDKIDLLWGVIAGLENIHNSDLYHGNIHGGNLMIEDEAISTDARISDIGIWGPANSSLTTHYGVLPYVAPEVLKGDSSYSKEADIYSFGILMWTISAGQRPFADVPHDGHLALEICLGKRPVILENTPPVYAELMQKAWDKDPKKRPTAFELNETFSQWITDICDNPLPTPISQEFATAEERRWAILRSGKNKLIEKPVHPRAFYTSQLLSFSEVEEYYNKNN